MKNEKKEVIEAEFVEKESSPKKENAFSKFWNKTKQNINDALLESKIESSFKKTHNEFTLYKKDSFLTTTLFGTLDNYILDVFGKHEVDNFNIIVDTKDNKAYYIIKKEIIEVESIVDGVIYKRSGTRFYLKDDLVEVNVIKAGNRYFIYKGND